MHKIFALKISTLLLFFPLQDCPMFFSLSPLKVAELTQVTLAMTSQKSSQQCVGRWSGKQTSVLLPSLEVGH